MSEETKFEVGDVVSWGGVRGKVNFIDETGKITVLFDGAIVAGNSTFCFFLPGGKIKEWHTEPSLKLISKAKKKRKVKLYAYLRERPTGIGLERNSYRELVYTDKQISGIGVSAVPELDKEVEIEE